MTTPTQAASNRVNAVRSTGPRTSEGRAVSALNARKHGLSSERHALLPNESSEQWAEWVLDFGNDLAPVGAMEELLVERIATAAWRLRRAEQFEVGALVAEGAEEDGVGVGKAAWRDAQKGQTLQLVLRYISCAERSLLSAVRELDRRRAAKKAAEAGDPVIAPVAVDITINAASEDSAYPSEP